MNKKYSAFIAALFCVIIFGFGIAQFIVPDREFSQNENRYLAGFTAPTWENLVSGEFMADFEDYVVDQFPLRDWWINLKARCEKLIGKKENNSVYFGTDGAQTLFAHFNALSLEELEKRVGYVNALAGNTEVPVYFALIPDKSFVWSDLLPDNAPKVDDGSMIEAAKDLCGEDVIFIDLSSALSGYDAFYRTDHHWTTFGAHQGYVALSPALGGAVSGLIGEAEKVSDSFFGTTWSSAGANWVKPDSIYTMVDESLIHVTRYPAAAPEEGELYDESFLEKKDKYSMFLGGNQPLCVLKNEQGNGEKLLVIRDSYCDSLAPFLASEYSEVHLLDLRYYKGSLPQYMEENGVDKTLVLYSNANFTTDNNLFLMGMG